MKSWDRLHTGHAILLDWDTKEVPVERIRRLTPIVVNAQSVRSWCENNSEPGDTVYCAKPPFQAMALEWTWTDIADREQELGAIVLADDDYIELTIVSKAGCTCDHWGIDGGIALRIDEFGTPEALKREDISVTKFSQPDDDKARHNVLLDLHVALTALTFMNCKNISLRESRSPAQRKAFERRRGVKPPRYHVLDVKPLRARIAAEAGRDAQAMPLSVALHLCRGHFKDFRERPLFGKHRGMFWWAPHARGAKDAGVVEKDYRIKLDGGMTDAR